MRTKKYTLEKNIEQALKIAWTTKSDIVRKEAQRQAEFYARQYEELTGRYYFR